MKTKNKLKKVTTSVKGVKKPLEKVKVSEATPEPLKSLTPTEKYVDDYHKNFCEKMRSLTLKKNSDYTGVSADPFKNLRSAELLEITTTEKGILTRMLDKVNRVNSFLDKGVLLVEDESIDDTLLDIANYAALLGGVIRERKENAEKK